MITELFKLRLDIEPQYGNVTNQKCKELNTVRN